MLNPRVLMLAGENEDIRSRIAGGLGGFAQFCSLDELRQMMAGPLATNSGQPADRLGKALTIASTAQHAAQRSVSKACIQYLHNSHVCKLLLYISQHLQRLQRLGFADSESMCCAVLSACCAAKFKLVHIDGHSLA